MKFIFLLFILSISSVHAQNILELRKQFYSASTNSDEADKFYSSFKNAPKSSLPIIIGYKGIAAFMICNHSYNPYKKIKYFSEGKSNLDNAIKLSLENIELRFLRFSVQSNSPDFIGYKNNLLEDKNLIIKAISTSEFKKKDADLFTRITNFLLESDNISSSEKAKIKNSISL